MRSPKEILKIITSATGTDHYHKFSPIPGCPVITDGVLYLAKAAECYWFLDLIASYQKNPKLDRSFQVWVLLTDLDKQEAIAQGYNDKKLIVSQKIPFTTFPLPELKLYLMDNIILLPSER